MNKYVNGVLTALTPEEVEEVSSLQAGAEAEQEANAWLDGRLSEYPALSEQFDNIYHNGIDAWKADIAVIKAKYPKPI